VPASAPPAENDFESESIEEPMVSWPQIGDLEIMDGFVARGPHGEPNCTKRKAQRKLGFSLFEGQSPGWIRTLGGVRCNFLLIDLICYSEGF